MPPPPQLLLLFVTLLLLLFLTFFFLKFVFNITILSTLFQASVSNQNFTDDFLNFDFFSRPFLNAYNGLLN